MHKMAAKTIEKCDSETRTQKHFQPIISSHLLGAQSGSDTLETSLT